MHGSRRRGLLGAVNVFLATEETKNPAFRSFATLKHSLSRFFVLDIPPRSPAGTAVEIFTVSVDNVISIRRGSADFRRPLSRTRKNRDLLAPVKLSWETRD